MALSIRLSRGGSKKRPYYRIVVADARSPRDGRFIERIGNYNPLLAKDDEKRVQLDTDRANHWLGVGAQPTDRVARFLDAAGVRERSEEHTSELQSLMRISYAVFCLTKKNNKLASNMHYYKHESITT